ncbi:MAG TPA: DPP IV N-terminal domain-containing protein, partial [Verrucomicrobiae bacterium]|nr:DPP IV N-terminal domain-containing protein [Verrucomicrobiae bacterium]
MHNSLKSVAKIAALVFTIAVSRNFSHAQEDTPTGQLDSPQQRRGGFGAPDRGVYKARIAPHWLSNNVQFWYRNDLRGGTKEFILVDAEKGTRQPAFDHQKLATALAKAAGVSVQSDKLPFSDIEFVDNGNSIQFDVAGKSWRCNLNTYECTAVAGSSNARIIPPEIPADSEGGVYAGPLSPQDQTNQPPRGQRRRFERDMRSPDGKWTAFVRDHNLFVRSDDDKETQLSTDGAESNSYGRVEWSPDSHSLVAWRIEPGDAGQVYLIQSSPPNGGRAVLRQRPYGQAGDKFPRYELNIFDVASHQQTKPTVDRYEHEYETPQLHWMRDHRHFAWQQEDRGHQRLRVIEASCDDGSVRNLVDEKTKTFIWTAHTENLGVPLVNWLSDDELIYVSEMDGWRHLYLVDTQAGKIKNQITKG